MNYGWKGTIEEFLQLSESVFVQTLTSFVYSNSSPDELSKIQSQQRAWIDCYKKLNHIFSQQPEIKGWLIFEYAILRGSGRRPDVLLLIPGHLFVIECKSYNTVNDAEFLQTSLYVRDIEQYHSTIQSSNIKVTGVLLLTNHKSTDLIPKHIYQVYLASPYSLIHLIKKRMNSTSYIILSAEEFVAGNYQPSPSMLEAARNLLHNEPLPRIKAVASSNFPEVARTVEQVIEEAKRTQTHHLILVSGEPGAGKTFLGLHLAHTFQEAVYLSGNGPLVDVLQDTLQNKTFVQPLYGYKRDYLQYGQTPHEKIIIFDEAQRAWDAKKMNGPLSEPDVIIQIAKTNKPWSVVIGLIGDGQEIHLGEEGGLSLWNQAIANQQMTVHAKHENIHFPYAASYRQHEHLHLNCSLRAHAALHYYEWVNALLSGTIEQATTWIQPLAGQRYPVFVTRDLEQAKDYVQHLYKQDSAKNYGILFASGADRLKQIPVVPFGQRNVLPKPATAYFNHSDTPYYCKNLRYAATEFQTQGLELDTAIVHWDEDLFWQQNDWRYNYTKSGALNPKQMKLNAYRVLLTRGRDATIIYIPRKPILDETYQLFVDTLKIPILSN